jgi:dolichyl-diphosphooligosaccharide---protein glycosyltransferase subunit 1 (ribophorin I)
MVQRKGLITSCAHLLHQRSKRWFNSRLDGHFSRLQFQQQAYLQRAVGNHVLGSFSIRLPPDVRDPYYTDIVGNVSTSRFRPAPPKVRSRASERSSALDVRPRYPLLGGWNYSFTLGWDAPLENSAVYDKSQNKYTISIPFFTHIPGSVVDDAEVKVILPEGASCVPGYPDQTSMMLTFLYVCMCSDVQIYTPFAMDSIVRDTHITFLDTKGRPSIVLSKRNLTEKHISPIYVRVLNYDHLASQVTT